MKIRPILIISALLGIASIKFGTEFNNTKGWGRFLFNSSPGLFVVSVLPWLTLIRRKLFKTHIGVNHNWMRATTILLLVALLVGPLAIATVYFWLKIDGSTSGPDRLIPNLVGIIFHCVSLGACIIAFTIQIWRDQWRIVLNALAILYHFGAFLLMIAYSSF